MIGNNAIHETLKPCPCHKPFWAKEIRVKKHVVRKVNAVALISGIIDQKSLKFIVLWPIRSLNLSIVMIQSWTF